MGMSVYLTGKNKSDGTNFVDSKGNDAGNVTAEITKMAKTPGDDDVNDVKVIEQGRFSAVVMPSGAGNLYADGTPTGSTTVISGTGARAGDYLHGILFTRGMTWEMNLGLLIKDTTDNTNIGATFSIAPAAGGGTAAGVFALNAAGDNGYAILPGTFIPVGLTAVNGWMGKHANGTIDMVGAVMIGRFSPGV